MWTFIKELFGYGNSYDNRYIVDVNTVSKYTDVEVASEYNFDDFIDNNTDFVWVHNKSRVTSGKFTEKITEVVDGVEKKKVKTTTCTARMPKAYTYSNGKYTLGVTKHFFYVWDEIENKMLHYNKQIPASLEEASKIFNPLINAIA